MLEVTAFSPRILDPLGRPIEPDYDEVPATYEWEIEDTEAPNASIDWGPPATTTSTNAVFGLSSDDPTAAARVLARRRRLQRVRPGGRVHRPRSRARTRCWCARRDLLDNVDQTPDRHDWTITQPGPPNTPVGTNVTVNVPMPDGPGNASFNFFEVNTPGTTSVDAMVGGPELPAGYTAGGARYYDIQTTAEFGEPMQLCLAYDPARYATSAVRLLQSDGGVWMDVTSLNNPFTGRICAVEADISQGESSLFAVAAANSGIAPFVSILSGPPLISNSPNATFELFADMPNSQVQCSIDGMPYVPCGPTVSYTHLEAGDHDLQVQALSPFGLPQLIPTLYEWEIVAAARPRAAEHDDHQARAADHRQLHQLARVHRHGQLHRSAARARVRVLDRRRRVRVLRVAGGDRGPDRRRPPRRGARGRRGAQRRPDARPSATSRSSTCRCPTPRSTPGPDSETLETTATFTFTGEEETGEPVFEFECMLDDTEFVPCSEQPYTITGVSGGPHVMYVRAKDPAGNVDPTPDFYEWLVTAPPDTIAPDTAIAAGPAEGELTGPDVLFAFQANEALVEFECRLDGAPPAWEGCEGLHELTEPGVRRAQARGARARHGRAGSERRPDAGRPQLGRARRARPRSSTRTRRPRPRARAGSSRSTPTRRPRRA